MDVISQIQYCVGVSNKLKNKAKFALNAITRFPVSEANDFEDAINTNKMI